MFSNTFLFFSLFCLGSVICKKRLCDFDNTTCQTERARKAFPLFVSGMPGVKSSDPLELGVIEANLSTLKYKATNSSITGLRNCRVDYMRISKDMKYTAHLGCPHLVIESKYETEGKIGPEFIEGKGIGKIDCYDYNLIFNGDYKVKDFEDGKMYAHVETSYIEVEAKGKVVYDYKNLYNGDKKKSDAMHKFANENWQLVDKLVRQPLLDKIKNQLIANVNDFLVKIAAEDIFSEE